MSSNDEQPRASTTIFDVARLAGVSHQTVSRVLNNLPNVRAATRERVEQAIRQLHYVPSQAARALVTRRSRTIGLVATGLPDFGPSSIVLSFNRSARIAGYAVIASHPTDIEGPTLRSAAEMLIRQSVEAIVLLAAERGVLDAFDDWELGVPLVAIASEARGRSVRVSLDQYGGARRAVGHLQELGHRDILHIAGPAGSMDAEERLRGWRDALIDAGMPVVEPLRGDWSSDSGYRIGQQLLAERTPEAVFVGNDQMTLGFLHALHDAGLRVPEDVSVVGFDDVPDSEHFSPPLTTVRQDFTALGQEAVSAVLAQLKDEESPVMSAMRIPELVVRASTRQR
ncbi:transcriptional regulator [Microbacterium sp. CH12i]|uniref:LacI family DNA-binding transcriptional regulator n=1 Tax=Microbacterium sp. CH12i TaxID=1479651 RepID=UPI000461CE85|nr:LacI family DNA-binding transcriptional regulator [Microbacterium sp. CH12i]KDA06707.1 transcriptional regulator [Microbacterium sp. CH12i]